MRSRCSLILCLAALPCFAARPYHTDDPGTTERGKFEVEISGDRWNNMLAPGIVFKHGFTDRMELDIPIGYTIGPGDNHEIAPAQLYAKFALIPDHVAITFTGALGDPSYSINAIASQSLGILTVNANLGGSMTGNTNDADLTYGLATLFTFGKFETGMEITGTQEKNDWWQIGAKFFVAEWFSFDLGFGGNFSQPVHTHATTGLWFAFPIAKQTKGN